MNAPIPYFRPSLPPREALHAAVDRVWASGRVGNYGPENEALEREVEALYPGTRAFAVTSCDVGLIIAVAACAMDPGSRVAVSDYAFQSTANAVLWNGHSPVPLDIRDDASYLCRVPDRRDDIGCWIATAPFGLPYPTKNGDGVRPDIIDAAHALGQPMSIPLMAVFSLSGTKVVTCGEGGLLLVNADYHDTIERVTRLRNYGFWKDYDARYVGINGKMDELRAAFARAAIAELPRRLLARASLFARYRAALAGTGFATQRGAAVPKDVIVRRDDPLPLDIVERMAARGVEVKRYFRPLSTQSAYVCELSVAPTTFSRHYYDRSVCLPFFEGLTDREIERVVETLVTVCAS